MTKDEYILKVLNKVKGLREPAENLIKMMEKNELTPEYKEYLYNHFTTSIHNAVVEKRAQLQEAYIKNLQKTKEKEAQEAKQEQDEVDNLENLLDTMF